MNKYNESKIYKISSPHTDKIYIGSTAKKYLCNRIAEHTSYYKRWKADNTNQYCSSFVLYQLGNVEYELIELYNCNNKEELRKRERYFMEQYSNFIVNIKKANRTKEEYKGQRRTCHEEWYKEHKEERIESMKKYNQANKDHIKQYRLANKEHINQKNRERYAKKKALKATQQI